MQRKGLPGELRLRRLVQFLADVKGGSLTRDLPVYSHLTYDIIPGEAAVIDAPDIVILEG